MRKSIILFSVILFLFNCSSNEGDLMIKNPLIGEWTQITKQNKNLQNKCEKITTIKITDGGNYSQSIFHKITDSNNNAIIIESIDSDGLGTWEKSKISNEYILTEENNQQILNTKLIVLKNNSIIDTENNITWKRIK